VHCLFREEAGLEGRFERAVQKWTVSHKWRDRIYVSVLDYSYSRFIYQNEGIACQMLQSMSSWCTDPPDFSNNGTAAHRAFAMLLCAHIFILKQLVQCFPAETNVMDARRRWVLAQVLPPCLEQNEDLFVTVLRALWNADTDIMLRIAGDLLAGIMTVTTWYGLLHYANLICWTGPVIFLSTYLI
jgi:hypothetical protein